MSAGELVYKLTAAEQRRALIAAIETMKKTLKCETCPMSKIDSGCNKDKCEVKIISALLEG